MAYIKNENEIKLISKACEILAEVKQILFENIRPGVSLKALDAIAFEEIKKRGAEPNFLNYHGFPASICASVNEELIHGIPSEYVLKEGDVLKIDAGCKYQGYHSDSAFTKIVGVGAPQDIKLVEVAKGAFNQGIKAIKPGATIGDISYAIGRYIRKQGYFTPLEFTGHGIGTSLHEDPNIPNYGIKGTGPKLKDGMVICIEPMILQDSPKIKIAKDGWTVISVANKNAAHYEHTILIKNGKPVILTKGI
ncbi:type I methionyl aminopeptidase [Mycoplasma phocimorsus]|uniref:Methionine aminopeptidase n=1 Tax=Mycoplasma phocimorsus TaxID=3045839 RepID=A0AAJ1UWN2_9MOLU|nr:type I methionyl aminopeptidase [Mycoplasma phocimorsus]MDJ1645807.1 type I methionyl aminopeptidase [Mycoplasma phocimorsus]MDJ1646966.1 type I methionyl aminopeptidase [Mycoplasma phocimorsus]MDJ1647414.1 type I methionyl aminopeptidase [Mycoplasma phocimorsus]MDJ1648334.1 type I methionyl aminopeptidase [Mycoplasma phocimorsus]